MNKELEKTVERYLSSLKKPIGFRFWEKKQESYLTLSAKLQEQDEDVVERIKELQERIIKKIKNIKIINDPYDANSNWGLFLYPEDRLHFSLINFLIYYGDFDAFGKITKDSKEYKEIKEKLLKKINNFRTVKAYIVGLNDGFYQNGPEKLDSLTLQIFPEKKIIEKLEKISKNTTDNLRKKISHIPNCKTDIKVKGFKDCNDKIERFGVNILRFINFNQQEGLEELIKNDKDKLAEGIKEINENFKNNKKEWILNIKKIILIESDPFLCKWNRIEEFDLNN